MVSKKHSIRAGLRNRKAIFHAMSFVIQHISRYSTKQNCLHSRKAFRNSSCSAILYETLFIFLHKEFRILLNYRALYETVKASLRLHRK